MPFNPDKKKSGLFDNLGMQRSPVSMTRALVIMTLLLSGQAIAGGEVRQKQIHGWVERVQVSSERLEMKAKLDTGAKTTSLHALNIERFKKDGQRMVRFDVEDAYSGRRVTLERPLKRNVRIKESDAKESDRRPVVKLWLCIGDIAREVEVNLVDRSRFIYPLLIGRSAMAGLIVVDPDETFSQLPSCSWPERAS